MFSDVLVMEERVNSNDMILHMLHMCLWDEDRSKFKVKCQRNLAKQAFTFYRQLMFKKTH